MSFGNKTITFVTVSESATQVNRLGVGTKSSERVDVPGCHHRPLRADETPEYLTNTAGQIWKSTCPPETAALAARSTGKLIVDGITYNIIGGAMPYTDLNDEVVKVTILSSSLNPAV